MYKAINSFPEQIKKSYEIMKNISFSRKESISDIIICGMGGSAIGGDLCKTLLYSSTIKLNVYVNRGYALPNWASKSSLVIISSYSGNTEETLSAFYQCLDRNCSILIFSTTKEIPKAHSPLTMINPFCPIVFINSSKDLSTKAALCEYHFGFDSK